VVCTAVQKKITRTVIQMALPYEEEYVMQAWDLN